MYHSHVTDMTGETINSTNYYDYGSPQTVSVAQTVYKLNMYAPECKDSDIRNHISLYYVILHVNDAQWNVVIASSTFPD